MKRALMILLLCCSIFNAEATVFVSGSISANTTWTKANSPYIVNGNLSVDSAVTLTIEPGVVVKVDSGCYFRVDGKLVAIGTIADTIKFTSNKSLPAIKSWPGIAFSAKGKNDTSTFNYCLFEYGDTTVLNMGSYVKANYSVFRNSNIGIMVNGALNFTNVYRCLLTKNNKGMHYRGKYASLSETILSFNDIGLFEESKGLQSSYDSFNYNRIGYWAVAVGQAGFDFNRFKGNSMYGMYLTSPTGTGGSIDRICNSVFIYNAKAIGLDSALAGDLYKNKFGYNDIGLEINYPLSYTITIAAGGGYFGQCFNKNMSYNVVNNSAISLGMYGCWWGTTSTPGIDSTIYDKNDNPSLGTVDYNSPLTTSECYNIPPPPPCLQLDSVNAIVLSSTTANVKWHKVANAMGYEYFIVPVTAPAPTTGITVYDTTINLTGLTTGQTYRVCVRTKCGAPPFASPWVCDTLRTTTGIGADPRVPQPRIYPNPNNGIFMADIPATMQAGEATVLDVNGRVIARQTYTPGSTLKFELGNIAKGIYVVQFTNASATFHTKLTVQ